MLARVVVWVGCQTDYIELALNLPTGTELDNNDGCMGIEATNIVASRPDGQECNTDACANILAYMCECWCGSSPGANIKSPGVFFQR